MKKFKKNLLIICDDPEISSILKLHLSSIKCNVICEDSLSCSSDFQKKNNTPDLVLLEINSFQNILQDLNLKQCFSGSPWLIGFSKYNTPRDSCLKLLCSIDFFFWPPYDFESLIGQIQKIITKGNKAKSNIKAGIHNI